MKNSTIIHKLIASSEKLLRYCAGLDYPEFSTNTIQNRIRSAYETFFTKTRRSLPV